MALPATPAAEAYDEIPFPSRPVRLAHPDRIATVATLLGLRAPPLEGSRILEVGCATGAHLLPLALGLPGCECVGIDVSERQLEAARADAAALGLANARFLRADLREPLDLGRFDYAIAHGVFSWIDPAAQDALLALIGRSLAPAGLAYVSYNVNPGWRLRGVARDAMLHAIRGVKGERARVAAARAFLEELVDVLPPADGGGEPAILRALLEDSRERVRDAEDVGSPGTELEFAL